MERLEGVFCALWTPADADGKVLWTELDRHLQFVLDAGVQGIMALGSTGEFIHFSLDERRALLERIAAACRRRPGTRIIANVSDVQCRNVIALGRHARSLGADCISVLAPWFFPLEQRDLAEFFIAAGRETGAPLALYNFPEVTGKQIALETIAQVARTVKVAAVKQSGSDFAYHHDLIGLGRELGFDVLTGTDTRFEEALGLGCTGTVSGLANALPEPLVRIFANHQRGLRSPAETAVMAELSRRIAPLNFPWNVRAAVAARGFACGEPKGPVSAETRALCASITADLEGWYHEGAAQVHPGKAEGGTR